MYDAKKIIPGLIIFLALATFPLWFNLASGKADYRPEPKPPADEKSCVESKDYMKTWHMDLLNQWREAVVRDGQRTYVSRQGKIYDMSLSLTCMKCHANKAQFCNQCHNYLAVSPYCWNCHIEPEGK